MVTRIFIIRHAEAEGNIFRRAHGWYNAPLTENGLKQVENLKNRLIGEHIDVIYSSDLRRTMQTAAAPSRACGLEIIPEKGLRELAMGDWENLSWGDCYHIDYELTAHFADNPDWRAPNTESVREMYERTGEALFRILERHEGQTVCLVSHSVAIRALMTRMLYNDIEKFADVKMVGNASLSLFEYENGVFTPIFISSNEHNAGNPLFLSKPMPGSDERPNLWFRNAEPSEVDFAASLWKDAWKAVHRSGFGFDEAAARETLATYLSRRPDAIRLAFCGNEPAGIVVFDHEPNEAGVLHIVLFMLIDKFRGHGLALQLFGECMTMARLAGKSTLRLRVAKKNRKAYDFYTKNGCYEVFDEGQDVLMKRDVLPVDVLK